MSPEPSEWRNGPNGDRDMDEPKERAHSLGSQKGD